MTAHVGNLLTSDDGEMDARFRSACFYDFDMIAIVMGLHHFDEPRRALRLLAERLKHGGILWVVDLCQGMTADDSNYAQMETLFESAGVGHRFDYRELGRGRVRGMALSRTVFLARGQVSRELLERCTE